MSTFLLSLLAASLFAQEQTLVTSSMILRAESSDAVLIATLLDQQLLPQSPDQVESIQFLDLAGDGFGEGDLLLLQPGSETHVLRSLSEELRRTLGSWSFASNHEILAEPGVEAAELQGLDLPVAGMLADVLQAADRHLGLASFELAVDRDTDGLRMRVWDYPGDSLFQRKGRSLDKDRVVDVVQILRTDTTYVVDRVLHDLLILESQVVDTLYLPQRKP